MICLNVLNSYKNFDTAAGVLWRKQRKAKNVLEHCESGHGHMKRKMQTETSEDLR